MKSFYKKPNLFILLSFFLVSIIFFSYSFLYFNPDFRYRLTQSDLEYIQNNEFIIVGDESYPPFSFINSDRKNDGYEEDLINKLNNEFGFNIKHKKMNWNNALIKLDSGDIDGISGMKVTEERKDSYYFTTPFLTTTQSFIYHNENKFSYNNDLNLDDIKNLNVIVQRSSITEELIKEYNPKNIILVNDPFEGVFTLIKNTDYVLFENHMTAFYYLNLFDIRENFSIKPLEETKGEYAMAISKENKELVSVLNKSLYQLDKQGLITYLDHKWFGILGERTYASQENTYYYVLIIYIIILLVFLFYLWSYTLHYNLSKKTKALKSANNTIKKNQKDMEKLLESISHSFAKTIDYRDTYTGNHSKRVSNISLAIASYMDLPEDELVQTYIGALVHDVGKIGIPDSILKKPGELTDKEYEKIKKHPQIGSEIFEDIDSFKTIKNIILLHHERWDGNLNDKYPGYPGLKKGEDIPVSARIVAVADAFDAMTSNRPYRKALPTNEAIKRIKLNSNKQFDPKVVNAFLDILELNPDFENEIESPINK